MNQLDRLERIQKMGYEAVKSIIPNSLDKNPINTGNFLGDFHYFAIARVVLKYGTDYEKQYIQNWLYTICDDGRAGRLRPGFTGAYAYRLMHDFKDVLGPKLYDKMKNTLDHTSRDLYDYHHNFIGSNDNFPALDELCGYCHYLLNGDETIHQIVIDRLRDFKDRLTRVTDNSEFNSPTYLQIMLSAIADIVNYSPADDPVHDLANYCVQRIVLMTLRRYHKVLKSIGGPYGRAYTVDSVGHRHHIDMTLYILLGEEGFIDLPKLFFETPSYFEDGHVIHGDKQYYWTNFINAASTPIQVEDWVWEEYKKLDSYPYIVKGSAESTSAASRYVSPLHEYCDYPESIYKSDELFEYPAGVCNLYTYMAKEYTLGSSDREWHLGQQTESFIYKGLADNGELASIYARMRVGKDEPYYRNSLMVDDGRKIVLQDQNSAVYICHMRDERNFAGSMPNPIDPIRLSLIIYNKFNVVDDIKQIGKNVYCRIGKQYIMIAPTNEKYAQSVVINRVNDFLCVDMYLPIDEEANRYRRGRMLNMAGFIFEVRDVCDYVNIDEFACKMGTYTIEDKAYANMDTRMTVMRKVVYDTPSVHIETAGSVVSNGIMYKEIYRKDNNDILTIK